MCYMRVCSGVPVSRVLGPEIESILKLQENKSSNLPTNLISASAWNRTSKHVHLSKEEKWDVCLLDFLNVFFKEFLVRLSFFHFILFLSFVGFFRKRVRIDS